MNLLEQIKEKAQLAKLSINRFLNPQGIMRFPTTSQDLSKSTEIAQRESDKGYYSGQGFEGLKNKLGMNYEDAQISNWQEGLKSGSPELAALKGNNPAIINADFTGSLAAKKQAQQVANKVGEEVIPVAKNLLEDAKKYTNINDFINSQIKTDYRSPHQIDFSNSVTADKINIESLTKAMKEKKGWLTNYDVNDLNRLKKIINNPDKEITIYRTSPKNELNPGDWVTTDRIYANDIKRQNGGKVYSYKAKVSDLLFPNDFNSLPSSSIASAFQYNPKISELTDIWNKANKKQNVFQGFKDLSTKLLEDLKGKSVVDKKFIEQRLVSSDLNIKQVEKDLIRSKLVNYPDKLDVNDFAESVKTDLLPLTIKKQGKSNIYGDTGRYEAISLPGDIRGNIQNYSEHIYESPIKTSAGDVHFSGDTQNYFGHTRIEDLADSSLDKALRKSGGTRRVIEVQSDLYQRERLKRESLQPEKNQSFKEMINEINKYDDEKFKNNPQVKRIFEIEKLYQYSDPTAHYRMVREEVKLAAQDGKTKLQFPTGKTAMQIEGLGGRMDEIFFENINKKGDYEKIKLTEENIKSGKKFVDRSGAQFIITEVLEDGKFKAVPKDVYTRANDGTGEIAIMPHNEETFDISGKVDTNNPIYKFYEKELGKYLKSKYDAKLVTDKQGVNWYEINIKPEWKDLPVEAFGFSSLQQMVKAGGLIGGGLIAQDILRGNKTKKEPTREEALEVLKQRRDALKLENTNLQGKVDKLQQKQEGEIDKSFKVETIDKEIDDYIKQIKVIINKNKVNLGHTLADDNNNPGNLLYMKQPNSKPGKGGVTLENGQFVPFAKFDTKELGYRGLIKQMQADQRRNLTLREFVTKYAPPKENDTELYINTMKNWLNIEDNYKINKINPIELAKWIAKFESQTEVYDNK